MSRTTSHAPSANFVTAITTPTMPVATAPRPLMTAERCQPGSRTLRQWHHHARLRQGEAGEDPHRVQRDQLIDAPVEDHQQHDRQERQRDDAGGEGEPVAAELEHPRQEPIARQDRASRGKSANEVLAARIRISAVAICSTHHSGPTPKTVRPIWEMTVSSSAGRISIWIARNDRPRNMCPAARPSTPGWRARWRTRGLEGGHAVGDRLGAGHRRTALGERAQEDEEAERLGRRRR